MSDSERDLTAPGKPLQIWVKQSDGSRTRYPAPQTKWDNCEQLMRELAGETPTDEQLSAWGLSRSAYEHFLEGYPASRR